MPKSLSGYRWKEKGITVIVIFSQGGLHDGMPLQELEF